MEYRSIRYTIRTRIERDQWSVAIHPAGVEMKGRVVIGPRSDAELQARALIDSWLIKHAKSCGRGITATASRAPHSLDGVGAWAQTVFVLRVAVRQLPCVRGLVEVGELLFFHRRRRYCAGRLWRDA